MYLRIIIQMITLQFIASNRIILQHEITMRHQKCVYNVSLWEKVSTNELQARDCWYNSQNFCSSQRNKLITIELYEKFAKTDITLQEFMIMLRHVIAKRYLSIRRTRLFTGSLLTEILSLKSDQRIRCQHVMCYSATCKINPTTAMIPNNAAILSNTAIKIVTLILCICVFE